MAELPRVLIVGASFAGYTAALQLARELGAGGASPRAQVTVVSNVEDFTFIPSLIWVPFGLRDREDLTFPLRPPLEKAGVRLVVAAARRFDLERRVVETSAGDLPYDYLLVATGPTPLFDDIPGLGPGKNSVSICTFDHAREAGEAWQRLVEAPGPAVIGATQGSACFGAAYEFVLNLAHQVRKRGLAERIPITFVTAEPYLGHFGIGNFGAARKMTEAFFTRLGIAARTDAVVERVEPDAVVLAGDERLPSRFTMLIPAFAGVDAVRASPGLANEKGFIEVDDAYRHPRHPEVFAAGVAVAVKPPFATKVPIGVPKTGYVSEEMARVAAHNIAAAILGGDVVRLPFASIDAKCILDAGNTGVIMTADHMLEPRSHAWLIPGPEAHWAKLAFEKYFMATRRRGWA
ncbi:MAG: FAD-dependent oxidoreductase [Planctomycetes bacterium]|nr:FAD-dependent oxidoreductase [Planctomycetota bacterium]